MATVSTMNSSDLFTQEDINNTLKAINKNINPLWSLLLASGRVDQVQSTDIAWFTKNSRPSTARLGADITDVATTLTVDDEDFGVVEQIIRIDDELLKVTAVSGTPAITLTVTRGFGGTTATAHTTGTQVKFNGFDLPEDSDAIQGKMVKQKKYTNITQPVMEQFELTETAKAVLPQGTSNKKALALELVSTMETLQGQIENAIVSGVKFDSGNTRRMAGLESIVEDNGIVKQINGDLTFEAIDEACRDLAYAGAKARLKSGMYYLVAPLAQIPKINALNQNIVDSSGNAIQRISRTQDEILGTEILQIRTSAGTIKVLEVDSMTESKVGIFDIEELRLKALVPVSMKNLALTGLVDKYMLHGEYSIEVGKPTLQLLMTGLTV